MYLKSDLKFSSSQPHDIICDKELGMFFLIRKSLPTPLYMKGEIDIAGH
jgi:hypothetical protein